jgi:uncharacterized LabA/DUF88 family protein
MMEDTLVFIDAGFLSKLSKYFGGGKYLTYDIIQFSKNLAKEQKLDCKHIFYYTAPPFQSERPTKEENERFRRYEIFREKLSNNKIMSVKEGRCQRLKAGNKFEYSQKGVDALLIIDLISVPLQYSLVKKVILMANDSDFVPAVKRLKELRVEVLLFTFYSKNRESSFSRSNELLKTVSSFIRITKEDFIDSSLPEKTK